MENDLSDFTVDGLLATFLDLCRAEHVGEGSRDLAFAALQELRSRIYWGGPLPRDPRPSPEELASIRERIMEIERLRTVVDGLCMEIERLIFAPDTDGGL